MAEKMSGDDIVMFRIMEERLHDPEVRRSADLTSALLAEDFIEFGSSGRIYGRAEIIEALGAESIHPSSPILAWDYKLMLLSEDAVLLTYQTKADTRHSLRSSIWRRADGRWQMVFHQGTKTGG